MKKKYESPQITVMDMIPYTFLSTSGFDIESDSQGDFEEDFAKGYRGVWGNLWDKGGGDDLANK